MKPRKNQSRLELTGFPAFVNCVSGIKDAHIFIQKFAPWPINTELQDLKDCGQCIQSIYRYHLKASVKFILNKLFLTSLFFTFIYLHLFVLLTKHITKI